MRNTIAVIDMGTNTFQLGIAEITRKTFKLLFEKSTAVKLGKGGISNNIINDEASQRAIMCLNDYKEIAKSYSINQSEIIAIGTSAIRNATNAASFQELIQKECGISITIINGNKEAELINEGVKAAISFKSEPYLIMDIGGGSVEFIISNEKQTYWKQSFEIGGQRLMDKYFQTDPITTIAMRQLDSYLEEKLIPLMNAIHQYSPKVLIGSAGTFETLVDMYFMKEKGHLPEKHEVAFNLPIHSFYNSFQLLVESNRDERMAIPGMIPLRVDMIVVGVCMILHIIKKVNIEEILVSNFALKEGVFSKLAKNEPLI